MEAHMKVGIRILVFALAGAYAALAQVPRTSDEENTIAVFKHAQHALVHINVSRHETEPLQEKISAEATGSGFLIDRDGAILTNYHVVENSNHIDVYLPGGRKVLARLVGTAPGIDVALLKVDIEEKDAVEPLPLGDSDDVEVGQKVIAVGNPLAFHNSLTVGVLSAVRRSMPGSSAELDDTLLQTDAAINPGNSGGPLLDSAGRVIGIATARDPHAQNIGLAVPINLAKRVIPDLIQMGHPYRPPLGINGVEITPQVADLFGLPRRRGFLVEDVYPGSLAYLAGIRAGNRTIFLGGDVYVLGGDIVTAINGKEVSSASEMQRFLMQSRPGQRIRLTILRDGQVQEIELPLEPMHAR